MSFDYITNIFFKSNENIKQYNTRENRMIVFNSIYNECKNDLYLNKPQYSINKNRVTEFINLNPEKLKPLLSFIFSNIIHVSFEEFITNFKEYFYSATSHKRNIFEGSIKIVLIVNGLQLKKSNFWLSLIIKDIINKGQYQDVEIVDIQPSITDAFQLYKSNEYIYILADDCSYSGTQVSSDLCINKDELDEINNSNVLVYPIIPYISSHAFNKKFKETFDSFYKNPEIPHYLIFIEDKITFFDSFWDLCVKKQFDPVSNDIYFVEKDCSNTSECDIKSYILHYLYILDGTCLIYFDHKMADSYSTIQQFLVYPRIFNGYIYEYKAQVNYKDPNFYNTYFSHMNSVKCKLCYEPDKPITDSVYYWIINNCENIEGATDNYIDDLNEINKACPKTFYKEIEFKFNNKPIELHNKYLGLTLYDAFYLMQLNGGYYKKYKNIKKEYLITKYSAY